MGKKTKDEKLLLDKMKNLALNNGVVEQDREHQQTSLNLPHVPNGTGSGSSGAFWLVADLNTVDYLGMLRHRVVEQETALACSDNLCEPQGDLHGKPACGEKNLGKL